MSQCDHYVEAAPSLGHSVPSKELGLVLETRLITRSHLLLILWAPGDLGVEEFPGGSIGRPGEAKVGRVEHCGQAGGLSKGTLGQDSTWCCSW